MALNRQNLTLDEHFFQSVLSAAFTIQQHKDRRKLAWQTPVQQTPAPSDLADPSFLASLVAEKAVEETIRGEETETIRRSAEDAELTVQPFQPFARDDASGDAQADPPTGASTPPFSSVPKQFFRDIVEQALQATHASGAAIALLQQGTLMCRAATGDFVSEFGQMITTGTGFTGACTSTGTMQLCSNTALDSRADASACRKLGISAILVMPLLHQDRLLGLMAVFSRRPYAFGMRDLHALHDLAQRFAANL